MVGGWSREFKSAAGLARASGECIGCESADRGGDVATPIVTNTVFDCERCARKRYLREATIEHS